MGVDIPIVSLDKIYIKPDNKNIFYLNCTRLDNSDTVLTRRGSSLDEQIVDLVMNLPENKIVLADDVVFSGNVLRTIISKFNKLDVQVIGIISSVAMEESYNYFNSSLPLGLRCNYLLMNDVIDQICERDFYFGIAGSGILVSTDNGFCKAPYFKPYGDPYQRASIPLDSVRIFSIGCLDRSIALFQDAESNCSRKILMSDLPEKIINTNQDDEVVKTLKKERDNL